LKAALTAAQAQNGSAPTVEPLVVPGEFFPSKAKATTNIARLRTIAGQFAPSRPTRARESDEYIPRDLSKNDYVFVRDDAI
jgi:hypothetical protein